MLPSTTRSLALTCARRNNRLLASSIRGFSSFENEGKGRPVSPHIMIYAWPVNAIASITMRITGGLLTVGMYGVGIGGLLGADMPQLLANLGDSGIGPLVKLSIAFPFSFHFLGSLRHFYWEKNPAGLDVPTQEKTSWGLFGVAGAISTILMIL